ncbi:MAG: ABC transporter permease [Candidatus Eisenbacteria bacterium]|nr:ABC transporter permease [Candidatus Eisenbacteria bacterium]
MRTILAMIRKDLLRRMRAPLAPLVFLLFPFLFSGLIALAFGSGGEERRPRFKLAVVDEDKGFVAGLVRGALEQEQAAEYLEASESSLEDALASIARNRIAGAIVIPAGFTDAVWKGEPAHLRVIRNPAQSAGPVAVEETAELLALFLNGAGDLLAEPIGRIRSAMSEGDANVSAQTPGGQSPGAQPPTAQTPSALMHAMHDTQVAEIAVTTGHVFDSAGRFLLPPRIHIEKADAPGVPVPAIGNAKRANENASADESRFAQIFRYVLPGMAAFALFILAIGLTADIFTERRLGTLSRQIAAPIRTLHLILGKMGATLVVGMIVALLMAVIGGALLGIRANLLTFALLALAFLFAVTAFVTLIYSLARNEQRGGTFASIVLMIMAFLGGSFIPLESLPAFARALSPFTLNYWATRGFQTLLFTKGGGVSDIAAPLAVFAGVGAASAVAGAWLLQRLLRRGS